MSEMPSKELLIHLSMMEHVITDPKTGLIIGIDDAVSDEERAAYDRMMEEMKNPETVLR